MYIYVCSPLSSTQTDHQIIKTFITAASPHSTLMDSDCEYPHCPFSRHTQSPEHAVEPSLPHQDSSTSSSSSKESSSVTCITYTPIKYTHLAMQRGEMLHASLSGQLGES